MTPEFYFFDQYSCLSHIGGIYRTRKNSKDLNQALYYVKMTLSIKEEFTERSITPKSNLNKKQAKQIFGENTVQIKLHNLKTSIIPETLINELVSILQKFDKNAKKTLLSSSKLRFYEYSTNFNEQHLCCNDETIESMRNLSEISLPTSLVFQLNASWSDLVKDSKYEYKIWHTKAGEEAWHQHVTQKFSPIINHEKQRNIVNEQSIIHRRTSSHVSLSSLTSLSRRQSLRRNSKMNINKSSSCESLSISNISQDNRCSSKTVYQDCRDPISESIKNGIHVEFKLSTQLDKTKQNEQKCEEERFLFLSILINEHAFFNLELVVLFNIQNSPVNFDEQMIVSVQNKCKRLLAEMKAKILAINDNPKICRTWFYEDNRNTRNKNNSVVKKTFYRGSKSKFVLEMLRNKIPENYNINIDMCENKPKCYIELTDGSSQIYYPSGRLAVLCLQPSHSTTLFFDDTNSIANRFLGLVTFTGNVLLVQPAFYAHFVTNDQRQYAYLCDGNTGIIQRQIQLTSTNNKQIESDAIDEKDFKSTIIENTIQFQLNQFMQLEYHNLLNIRFGFTCQNENFQYQLGIRRSSPSTTSTNLMSKFSSKKNCQDQTCSTKTKTKKINSMNSNNVSIFLNSESLDIQKLLGVQPDFYQLPMQQELNILRKRIRHICQSWLKLYRIILGIMNNNVDYRANSSEESLSKRMSTQTKSFISNMERNKTIEHISNVSLLPTKSSADRKCFQSIHV